MDKKEYLKNAWAKGRLVIGYTSLKILDFPTAITMARIDAEYNNAVKKGVLISDYCFGYDEAEIAQRVGLTIEEVQTAIKNLENLGFIKTKIIKSEKLIHLYTDNICDYISNAERKNNYKEWDYGLNSLQLNAFKKFEFIPVNQNFIEEMKNEDDEDATDEFGNLLKF